MVCARLAVARAQPNQAPCFGRTTQVLTLLACHCIQDEQSSERAGAQAQRVPIAEPECRGADETSGRDMKVLETMIALARVLQRA